MSALLRIFPAQPLTSLVVRDRIELSTRAGAVASASDSGPRRRQLLLGAWLTEEILDRGPALGCLCPDLLQKRGCLLLAGWLLGSLRRQGARGRGGAEHADLGIQSGRNIEVQALAVSLRTRKPWGVLGEIEMRAPALAVISSVPTCKRIWPSKI